MRKSLLFWVGLGLLLVLSKPSDEDCIYEASRSMTGSSVAGKWLGRVGVSEAMFTVNDYLLYKQVTNNITGQAAGIGCLCHVFTF